MKDVIEGRMEGKPPRGRKRIGMIDSSSKLAILADFQFHGQIKVKLQKNGEARAFKQ